MESKDQTTPDVSNLSEMFDSGFKMYNELNKSDKPTNLSEIQSSIKRLMNIFENVTKLVSLADIFSSNENYEEIATENLKYFLLPALLGSLTTKISEINNRMHIVDTAEIYFVDFLKRLKSYELIDIEIPETVNSDQKKENNKSNAELITELVNARNTKIQRYKQLKELEEKLEILQNNLDNPNIDDEVKREYFITLIKIFANQAIDELSSLAAERSILEHMKNIGADSSVEKKHTHKEPVKKLQPIIITRDAVQKKVYGLGYPSVPVLTVEEFYDQRVKSGEWPDHNQTAKNLQDIANRSSNENLEKDKEDEEKERKIESDDSEYLAQARAMDEYKDDHRRGWGNRANRS